MIAENESGGECRGVVADTQIDVESDGDCPQE